MARKQRDAGKRRRVSSKFAMKPRKYARLEVDHIDYKDLNAMKRFLSDRGKVRSRRVTGLSRKHQSELALATKRAREIGLLPYVVDR